METARLASEVYREAVLAEAPRVLSLMDREPCSPTVGCGDRVYWAWKFVDFPGARFQESLCVLAFLYSTEFKDNVYCGNPRLLEWIGQGMRFWISIQYRDGSFDEAYPFERSLAATAFTTFYVGEAMNFIEDSLPDDLRAEVRNAMIRAGTWLCRNDETHGFLSNHLAAAAGALQHVYRVSGDEAFADRSRYFLRRILDRQSEEGWYDEYGGADPGYQTHGSFYLARCWQMTEDEELELSLRRSMDFLALFVHPDGSIGGEYTSRNTQTYYPAAFEIFADRHAAAAWIAAHMRPTVMSGAAADLRCVDSYNFYPFLNNTVFAYLACRSREEQASEHAVEAGEPRKEDRLSWFPKAGLVRIRRPGYVAYVGTAKGGVLKVFDRIRGRLICNDCGYLGKLSSGRVIASQYQDSERAVDVTDDKITVRGGFAESSRPTMTPARFGAFRLFLLSVGRSPALARWLKGYLVKVLIHRKRKLDIEFERVISFGEDSISVHDRIKGPDGKRVSSLEHGEVFTTIHMGSSRYFINNELNETGAEGDRAIDTASIVDGVTLERVITIGSGESE
jgi:hypothetical protein